MEGRAKVALKKDKKAEKEGGGRRQGEQGGVSFHLELNLCEYFDYSGN